MAGRRRPGWREISRGRWSAILSVRRSSLRSRNLPILGKPPVPDETLYAAFVLVCARHHLHFFDGQDQKVLLEDCHRLEKDYDLDLDFRPSRWMESHAANALSSGALASNQRSVLFADRGLRGRGSATPNETQTARTSRDAVPAETLSRDCRGVDSRDALPRRL